MPRPQRLGRPDQNYQPPKGRLHALLGPALMGLAGGVDALPADTTIGAAEASAVPSISADQFASDYGVDPNTLGVTNTQTAALNPTAISQVQTPQFKKPGFWANLVSGGQAGSAYNRAAMQTTLTGYDARLKEALNQQTRAAMLQQAQAAHLNKLMEEDTRIKAEEASKKAIAADAFSRLPEEEKIKAAYRNNVDPANFGPVEQTALAKLSGEQAGLRAVEPLYGTPAYNKSYQDKLFAENATPGVKNLLDQSTALKNNYIELDRDKNLINIAHPTTGSFITMPGEKDALTREARSSLVKSFNPVDGTLISAVRNQQTPPSQNISDLVNAAPPNPIQPQVTIPTSPNDLSNPYVTMPSAQNTPPGMLDTILSIFKRMQPAQNNFNSGGLPPQGY